MNLRKQYKGRSAGGYVKEATVKQMRAGNYEIVTPSLPDHILVPLYINGETWLQIMNASGVVVRLLCSKKAGKRLSELEVIAEALTKHHAGRR